MLCLLGGGGGATGVDVQLMLLFVVDCCWCKEELEADREMDSSLKDVRCDVREDRGDDPCCCR